MAWEEALGVGGADEVTGGFFWKGSWMLTRAATLWTGTLCWPWLRK
jgi:hypothetical protein